MGVRPHGLGDWVAAGAAWVLLGVGEAGLRVVPFRRLMPVLGLRADEARKLGPTPAVVVSRSCPGTRAGLARVNWAVDAAARRTPWNSRCLSQALAGTVLLRVAGRPAQVWFGVRPPGPDRSMTAHAWLVSDDAVLTGAAGRQEYGVVAVYATTA